MASKKDSNFLLYSLGSDDDDDHAGDDMVYSSLLASPDSDAAFVSDDDEAVDTHKAVHEVPHDVAPVPQWRMATIALWQVLLTPQPQHHSLLLAPSRDPPHLLV